MPMQARRGGGGITPNQSQPCTRRSWVVSTTLRPLYPYERPSTHCTGGRMGPKAGLDGTENFAPHPDSIPEPSSP